MGFLADKRKANIEAAAWKDTQCELDVRRIRDREDSACKPVSSPARFDVGECAVVMRYTYMGEFVCGRAKTVPHMPGSPPVTNKESAGSIPARLSRLGRTGGGSIP